MGPGPVMTENPSCTQHHAKRLDVFCINTGVQQHHMYSFLRTHLHLHSCMCVSLLLQVKAGGYLVVSHPQGRMQAEVGKGGGSGGWGMGKRDEEGGWRSGKGAGGGGGGREVGKGR